MKKDLALPTDIAIRNVGTEPITFKYYGVSLVKTLAPDEEVVISGASSEATGYYLALLDDVKGLDIKVNATDGGDDTPDDPDEPVEETHIVEIRFVASDTDEELLCNPTLDGVAGSLDDNNVYHWFEIIPGTHELVVEDGAVEGYHGLEEEIEIVQDASLQFILEPIEVEPPVEDTYEVKIKFVDIDTEEALLCGPLLDGVNGELDDNNVYHWFNIVEGYHTVEVEEGAVEGYLGLSETFEVVDDITMQLVLQREPVEDTYEITAKFIADDTGEDLICNPTLEGAEGELDDNNVYHWRDLSNGDYDLNVAEDGAFGYWGLYANITVNNANVHVEYTLESKNAEPETFNLRVRGISSDDDTDVIMSSGVLINEDTGDEIGYSHPDGNDLIFEDMTVGNYWGRFEAYGYKDFDSSVGMLDGSNDLSLSFEPRVEEIALIENNLYALADTINIYDGDDNPVTVERDPRGVMFYVARLNDGETYHIVATKEGYENIDEFFTIDYSGPVRHNFNWVKAPVVPTTFQVALSFDCDGTYLELDDVTLDSAQPDDVSNKGEQYVYMWNNVENGNHLLYAIKYGYYDVEETITVNGTNYNGTINMEEEPEIPETYKVSVSFTDDGNYNVEIYNTTLDNMQPDEVENVNDGYVYIWNNMENGEHELFASKGWADFSDTITVDGADLEYTMDITSVPDEPDEPDEPEDLVDVMFHGVDSNGNDMWNGSASGYQISVGETLDRNEVIDGMEINHPIDGYHIDGYFSDMECTQEFDFDEPIMENTDVYVLYAQDEEEPEANYCTVRLGFNSEDDGAGEFVQLDDIELEITSYKIGEEFYPGDSTIYPSGQDGNGMYIFENVPEGVYQVRGSKTGYARVDNQISSVDAITNNEFVQEITLSHTTAFYLTFIGIDGSHPQMDSVKLLDKSDEEFVQLIDSVYYEDYNGEDRLACGYTPAEAVYVDETYYIVATKEGYEDVRYEMVLDGWEYIEIPLTHISDEPEDK